MRWGRGFSARMARLSEQRRSCAPRASPASEARTWREIRVKRAGTQGALRESNSMRPLLFAAFTLLLSGCIVERCEYSPDDEPAAQPEDADAGPLPLE